MIESLPFSGNIEYKRYKNSFLQLVVVTIVYSSALKGTEIISRWNNFIQKMFSVTPEKNFIDDKFVIANQDNSVEFVFSSNQASVLIRGENYKGFADSVVPFVFRLRLFAKDVLRLQDVDGLNVRKLDVWQVGAESSEEAQVDEVLNYIFSKQYIEYHEHVDVSFENQRKLLNPKALLWSDLSEKNKLLLRSGAIRTQNNNVYKVILQSEYKRCDITAVHEIEDLLNEMNFDLYRAFDWSVNQNVKNAMDGIL